MKLGRPDWTYPGWWRWWAIGKLRGYDLETKLVPSEFGGGRRGGFLMLHEITQYMCSVAGCDRRAQASWAGCADQNINRPLCPEHDVQINLMVLYWWGDPNWEKKIREYVVEMEEQAARTVESWAYDPAHLLREIDQRLHPTNKVAIAEFLSTKEFDFNRKTAGR